MIEQRSWIHLPLLLSYLAIVPVKLVDLFVIEVVVDLLQDYLATTWMAEAWLVVVEASPLGDAIAACGYVAPLLGILE